MCRKRALNSWRSRDLQRFTRDFLRNSSRWRSAALAAATDLAAAQQIWTDLQENGEVELFAQGDQEPYERERPASRIYTAANKSYQSIIKQLNDMIPKEAETSAGGFNVD